MKRFNGVAILAGLALLAAVGCGPSDSGGSTTTTGGANASGGDKPGKGLKIAVIPKGSTHSYWKHLHLGANNAASELGCEIQFKGPLKESDKEDQIQTVENFITAKVDGIVLAPLDSKALAKSVADAKAAGIPVVIIDSGLESDKFDAAAMTDNYQGGVKAAKQLATVMGDKGSVIMLRYEKGSASTEQREQGWEDEIKKHSGIKIISDNEEAGATVDSAQQKAESLLGRFKNPDGTLQAQGIYCPNESSTAGMLLVLRELKLAGKVRFVGFDSSDKLNEGLEKGEIDGLIVQDPVKMGHDSVATMIKIIKKQAFDRHPYGLVASEMGIYLFKRDTVTPGTDAARRELGVP